MKSLEPLTTRPSDVNVTALTRPEWWPNVVSFAPVATSQRRVLPSDPPASSVPDGSKRTDWIADCTVESVIDRTSAPLLTSQTLACETASPVATFVPSGDQSIALIASGSPEIVRRRLDVATSQIFAVMSH